MRRLVQCAFVLLLGFALPLALAQPALAQSKGAKRLVLKDGTYQMATKWEIKGERLRYYSAERFTWEELPKSLVDWPATEQFEKDHPAGVARETEQLSAEEAAEKRTEEAKTPEVAPGLKLPYDGGVILLDRYAEEQSLVEMEQAGGEIDAQRGKNVLRAALNPFASLRQSIELKGTHAPVQAHQAQPVFYLNVDSDEPADKPSKGPALPPGERFRIVRAQLKKDTRVVGNLKIALTGHITQQGNWVAVRQHPVSGGWVQLEPAQPLAPGEYAIVEMLNAKEMNLYVWDFGVDPAAPRNASAWRAAPVRTPGDEKPTLEKRR